MFLFSLASHGSGRRSFCAVPAESVIWSINIFFNVQEWFAEGKWCEQRENDDFGAKWEMIWTKTFLGSSVNGVQVQSVGIIMRIRVGGGGRIDLSPDSCKFLCIQIIFYLLLSNVHRCTFSSNIQYLLGLTYIIRCMEYSMIIRRSGSEEKWFGCDLCLTSLWVSESESCILHDFMWIEPYWTDSQLFRALNMIYFPSQNWLNMFQTLSSLLSSWSF